MAELLVVFVFDSWRVHAYEFVSLVCLSLVNFNVTSFFIWKNEASLIGREVFSFMVDVFANFCNWAWTEKWWLSPSLGVFDVYSDLVFVYLTRFMFCLKFSFWLSTSLVYYYIFENFQVKGNHCFCACLYHDHVLWDNMFLGFDYACHFSLKHIIDCHWSFFLVEPCFFHHPSYSSFSFHLWCH